MTFARQTGTIWRSDYYAILHLDADLIVTSADHHFHDQFCKKRLALDKRHVVAFGENEMGAIKRPLALPTIGDMSKDESLPKEEQRWVVESGEGAVLIYKHSVSNPGLYAMTYATLNGHQASWIVSPEIASDAWMLDEIECDGDRLIWTLVRGDDVAHITWYEDGSMSGIVKNACEGRA